MRHKTTAILTGVVITLLVIYMGAAVQAAVTNTMSSADTYNMHEPMGSTNAQFKTDTVSNIGTSITQINTNESDIAAIVGGGPIDHLDCTNDATIGGQIIAGSGAETLTNAVGLIDGSKVQVGTIDNDSLDNTDDYTFAAITGTGILVMGSGAEIITTVAGLVIGSIITDDSVDNDTLVNTDDYVFNSATLSAWFKVGDGYDGTGMTGTNTGALSIKGAFKTAGIITAGSGEVAITKANGEIEGTALADGTVDNDSLDATDDYTFAGITGTGVLTMGSGANAVTTVAGLVDGTNVTDDSIDNDTLLNTDDYTVNALDSTTSVTSEWLYVGGGYDGGSGITGSNTGCLSISGDFAADGDGTIGDGLDAVDLNVDGAAEEYRAVNFMTAGLKRLAFGVEDTEETGSDAGSNGVVARYDDAGDLLGVAIEIDRATGDIALENDLSAGGDAVVEGGSIEAGEDGVERGVVTAWDGAGGNTPGAHKMCSPNGTPYYVFLSDFGQIRWHTSLPTSNADGSPCCVVYADATGSTVSPAGDAEAAFDVDYTFPANALCLNKVVKIRADWTVIDNNSSNTLKIRLRIGGLTGGLIAETEAYDPDDGDTGFFQVNAMIKTCGASGVMTATELHSETKNSVNVVHGSTKTPSLDTTATLLVVVTYEWSASHAENDVQLNKLVVEAL